MTLILNLTGVLWRCNIHCTRFPAMMLYRYKRSKVTAGASRQTDTTDRFSNSVTVPWVWQANRQAQTRTSSRANGHDCMADCPLGLLTAELLLSERSAHVIKQRGYDWVDVPRVRPAGGKLFTGDIYCVTPGQPPLNSLLHAANSLIRRSLSVYIALKAYIFHIFVNLKHLARAYCHCHTFLAKNFSFLLAMIRNASWSCWTHIYSKSTICRYDRFAVFAYPIKAGSILRNAFRKSTSLSGSFSAVLSVNVSMYCQLSSQAVSVVYFQLLTSFPL